MTVKNPNQQQAGGRKDIDAATLISAINNLQPSERDCRRKLLEEALPSIQEALARGVSKSDLLAALKRQGVELSVGGFNAMLKKSESGQESDGGESTSQERVNR